MRHTYTKMNKHQPINIIVMFYVYVHLCRISSFCTGRRRAEIDFCLHWLTKLRIIEHFWCSDISLRSFAFWRYRRRQHRNQLNTFLFHIAAKLAKWYTMDPKRLKRVKKKNNATNSIDVQSGRHNLQFSVLSLSDHTFGRRWMEQDSPPVNKMASHTHMSTKYGMVEKPMYV